MFVLDPTIVVWKAITAAVWWQNPEDQYWSDIGQNFCNNYGTFDPIPKSKSSTTTCRQQGHDHLSVSSSRLLEEKGIRLILISAEVAISVSDKSMEPSLVDLNVLMYQGVTLPLYTCVWRLYIRTTGQVCHWPVCLCRGHSAGTVLMYIGISPVQGHWRTGWVFGVAWWSLVPPPTPQLGYSICPTLKY